MKMGAIACALALSLVASPAAAQGNDDIASKIISSPVPSTYRVDGLQGKPNVRSDPQVQGGKALRVDVPGKGANPWSIAVSVPIVKAVKAGDKLVLAMWVRLEKGENGATSATLTYNSVQLSHDPYTAIFGGPLTIGPEWKIQEIDGKADADHAAGELNVSIHLATAKQVVDIGPVFVLDMGQ